MAPVPLAPALGYQAPADKRAQLVYFRAGHSLDALVYVSLQRDGQVVRLFPLGARSAMHVPLAVIEDIEPGSKLTLLLGAPEGAQGTPVLDIGIVEVD